MADKMFFEITDWMRKYVKPSEHTKCFKCKKEMIGFEVFGYPHDGGWKTARGWQWLYIPCPHCNYQNSFAKMHIPHNIDFSKAK